MPQCDLVVLQSAYQIGSGVQWLDPLLHRQDPSKQRGEVVEDEDEQHEFLLVQLLAGGGCWCFRSATY
jgi:hypothetical protein